MATALRRFHLLMVAVWLALAVPGILWWRDSVLFVIILSLYANLAGELAAYQGSRTEQKQDEAAERAARAERACESCGHQRG